MAEIKNEEDLKQWLIGRPVEVSRVIALRCALRVLPLINKGLETTEQFGYQAARDKLLPVFRAYSSVLAVSLFPNMAENLTPFVLSPLSANIVAVAVASSESVSSTANLVVSSAFDADCTRSALTLDSAAATAAATASASARATHVGGFAASLAEAGIWRAIEMDCGVLERGSSTGNLANSQLWPLGQPDWFVNSWAELRTLLTSLGDDWQVWLDWFQRRIEGTVVDEKLESRRVLIPDQDWLKGPAHVNALIRKLEEERAREISEGKAQSARPPKIPPQARGIEWQRDPTTQAFEPKASSVKRAKRETTDLALMLPHLQSCARDLETCITASVSNSLKDAILPRAEAYRKAIDVPVREISIDAVHAEGVRLRNAHERLKADIAAEETPQIAHNIGEAFDSVIALHGPFVLGTKRGRELDQRARDHNRTREQDLAYKQKAQEFAAKVNATSGLVTTDGQSLLKEVNDEIATGPFPERSTALAENVNQNLLVSMSKAVVLGPVGGVASQMVITSATGKAAIGVGAAGFDLACHFLLGNAEFLRVFAMSDGGAHLSWLPSLLTRLQVQVTQAVSH